MLLKVENYTCILKSICGYDYYYSTLTQLEKPKYFNKVFKTLIITNLVVNYNKLYFLQIIIKF